VAISMTLNPGDVLEALAQQPRSCSRDVSRGLPVLGSCLFRNTGGVGPGCGTELIIINVRPLPTGTVPRGDLDVFTRIDHYGAAELYFLAERRARE
jgi:hypothetical protein